MTGGQEASGAAAPAGLPDLPDTAPGARSAEEVLAWSRDLLDPALRAAVGTLPASMRRLTEYHFGWSDAQGQPAHAARGKAIRPALVLVAAEAVGGTATGALPAAVAVELVHNFSLIHDDVMDGDATRRHRPTVWSVFGLGQAILAGDALLNLAGDVLSSGYPAARRAAAMLSAAVNSLLDGQNADLDFEERSDVDLAECLRMTAGKTGALLGCAGALGALVGGGTPAQVNHLRCFGEHLGVAFQFVDDLLGIWADPAVTGKPIYSDLRNGKKSLPVVAALTSGTSASAELAALYLRDAPPSEAEVARAAALVEAAGGREWSQQQADELLAQAMHHLRRAGLRARSAAELGAVALLATHRDR